MVVVSDERAGTRRRLTIALGAYVAVFAAELVTGLVANSLALLSDSAHVFTDLTGVALAIAASRLAERPTSERRTFGYLRLEILAALVNALLLFLIGAVVLVEALRRMGGSADVATVPMMAVAAIGLLVNVMAARLLHAHTGDLNARAVYLELASDALGSVAVLAAGLVIVFTRYEAADAIAAILIGALIVPRTIGLVRDAVHILLEGTPKDVEVAHVRQHILETDGVTDLHDLHVWTITSGMNVISAHVVVTADADGSRVLRDLARCLSEDFDIAHSTFQLEGPDHRAIEVSAHD